MSINVNEQVGPKPQKSEKATRRKWPLVVLGAVLMYIAPTVNSIIQQFLAAKWTIVIHISGFQFNLALLICEIIFTWLIMGVSFILGMFALPAMFVSLFTKQKMSRPVYIVLIIVFPLLWVWNYLFEKRCYRNDRNKNAPLPLVRNTPDHVSIATPNKIQPGVNGQYE